jgi:hypothetical protein
MPAKLKGWANLRPGSIRLSQSPTCGDLLSLAAGEWVRLGSRWAGGSVKRTAAKYSITSQPNGI